MLVVANPIIDIVIPRFEVQNICEVPIDPQVEQTEEEKKEKKRKRKEDKAMRKKAKFYNIQDKPDHQTWVQDMSLGDGSLGTLVLNIEGVYIVHLPVDDPFPIGTITEDSGTRS